MAKNLWRMPVTCGEKAQFEPLLAGCQDDCKRTRPITLLRSLYSGYGCLWSGLLIAAGEALVAYGANLIDGVIQAIKRHRRFGAAHARYLDRWSFPDNIVQFQRPSPAPDEILPGAAGASSPPRI